MNHDALAALARVALGPDAYRVTGLWPRMRVCDSCRRRLAVLAVLVAGERFHVCEPCHV